MDVRQTLIQELPHITLRQWTPSTLKTAVNGLANLYQSTSPQHGIVPSSTKQFPNFFLFFNEAMLKEKKGEVSG